jgi:hypothetical protein
MPSSLCSSASIVPFRERRNADEESTNKLLADNRELDEYNEKMMGEGEILQR